MSWRAQNIVSLLMVAALLLLNCVPASPQENPAMSSMTGLNLDRTLPTADAGRFPRD